MLRESLQFCLTAYLRFAERHSGGNAWLMHCASGSRWHRGEEDLMSQRDRRTGWDSMPCERM